MIPIRERVSVLAFPTPDKREWHARLFWREKCGRGDFETQSVPDHRRKPTPKNEREDDRGRKEGGHSKMPLARQKNEQRTQLSDYMTTEIHSVRPRPSVRPSNGFSSFTGSLASDRRRERRHFFGRMCSEMGSPRHSRAKRVNFSRGEL